MYKWWSWQAGRDDLEEAVYGRCLYCLPSPSPMLILIPYMYTPTLDVRFTSHLFMVLHEVLYPIVHLHMVHFNQQ